MLAVLSPRAHVREGSMPYVGDLSGPFPLLDRM